jgi:hypothetical protein
MKWLDWLKERIGQWRIEICFDVEPDVNALLRLMDDLDGVETTITVLPDEEQRLLAPPEKRRDV